MIATGTISGPMEPPSLLLFVLPGPRRGCSARDCNLRGAPVVSTPRMDDDRLHELVRQRSYGEAFEGLLDLYQDRVFRLAFSYTRERARAEELAQDVFVRI